ncbi:hypothetical protein [Streptosporangium sp. NPDC023615]|uniref:hypothetical protein n=1 Tax=Streptosporangium sp. NPDC023615 TaxID=3154794 RepID=UPI003430DAD2
MGPEIQLQMIAHRTAELRREAGDHRRAREVLEDRKARSPEKRRPGLFGRTVPA